MNAQTKYLAEKLFDDRDSTWFPDFDPQHSPFHSRMVLDAMAHLLSGPVVLYNTVLIIYADNGDSDWQWFVEFDFGHAKYHAWHKSLDQAICDAAEAALKGEEE